MNVLIIANFCSDFSSADNGRFAYIASLLSEKGHHVELITSSFYHSVKKHRKQPKGNWPFKITFIDEPGYPVNICLKRFYSHHIWGKRVLEYLKNRKKPDVVYCAIPSLSGPNKVAKYCEKNNIRFIIDVQDLWPEAFKMVFNISIISNIIFAPLDWLANGIYKRADKVCAVSETYINRALKVNKKCKKGYTVFLGTDLETFDENARRNTVLKSDNELWLGYCGTLGSSYDLPCVFDALKNLGEKAPKFIIMGDGPKRNEFESYTKELGLNVNFTGLLPYPQMCGLLKSCDMVVNPIIGKSAASIINKHADYAASGLPVLNTQECEEYRNLVESFNMGLNCRNNDAADLAEKLKRLIDDSESRRIMGKNARRCAEEKFDRKNSYKILADIINGEI